MVFINEYLGSCTHIIYIFFTDLRITLRVKNILDIDSKTFVRENLFQVEK